MGVFQFQSRGNNGMKVVAAAFLVVITASGVEAQVHHVVGGDRGWDPNSDLLSWSSSRAFRVGDQIWFTYSVAQGVIAELKSKEEYESCDISNPIKMYTEGLHTIPLEREGIRYFVSTDLENCNSGLKLPVHVLPKPKPQPIPSAHSTETKTFEAAAPITPSASAPNVPNTFLILIVLTLCSFIVALAY